MTATHKPPLPDCPYCGHAAMRTRKGKVTCGNRGVCPIWRRVTMTEDEWRQRPDVKHDRLKEAFREAYIKFADRCDTLIDGDDMSAEEFVRAWKEEVEPRIYAALV